MVLITFASALAAASLLLTAAAQTTTPTPTIIKNPITTPTTTLPANAMSTIGCFATGTPLENHGPFRFQSSGNCQFVCLELGKDVMGLSDGTSCWCGDLKPAEAWKINDTLCDTTCSGTDKDNCTCQPFIDCHCTHICTGGGASKLWVLLTGNTRNKVENYVPPVSSSSTSSAKPSSTTTATAGPISPTTTPSTAPKENSKPNTAGIAAGVVVGIVGLGAIIGGVWFFLRRRRQKQAEKDYRRNASNITDFVSGGKLHTSNSSMNDSRIDPSFGDRRQSNGSIADNEDYSRRILKVCSTRQCSAVPWS
jgi:cell wall integrity and stress response component